MWVVYAAVLWFFQGRRERTTAARLDPEGGMLIYVRYPDSRPGSLSAIWNMGVASIDGTGMTFQPAVYDNLEPSGRPTTFRALAAKATEPRPVRLPSRKPVLNRRQQGNTLHSFRSGLPGPWISRKTRPQKRPGEGALFATVKNDRI